MLGQCSPNAEAPAIGRVAALDAGLPVDVPGVQVDRRCGSALQAVIDGCMRVQTGAAELILAGGVESMSQTEYYSTALRWGARMGEVRPRPTGSRAGASRPAASTTRSRAACSKPPRTCGASTRSRARSRTSCRCARTSARWPRSEDGRFAEEIVPVTVRRRETRR